MKSLITHEYTPFERWLAYLAVNAAVIGILLIAAWILSYA